MTLREQIEEIEEKIQLSLDAQEKHDLNIILEILKLKIPYVGGE